MSERYSAVARTLHWVTAALVLPMIPLGFVLDDLPRGVIQNTAFDIHRSIGMVLLPLVLARLLYRATHSAPPLPSDMAAWQRGAAHLVHGLLYLILLANPLVGWWGTSAYGAPISVFWLFDLPMLVAKNEALGKAILFWHGWIGIALSCLIALHIGAALQHHFIRRDGVLRRMWG